MRHGETQYFHVNICWPYLSMSKIFRGIVYLQVTERYFMGSFTFKLNKDISWDRLPSSYRKIFRGIFYLQVTERYFVGSFTFKLQKDISWDLLPSSYRKIFRGIVYLQVTEIRHAST